MRFIILLASLVFLISNSAAEDEVEVVDGTEVQTPKFEPITQDLSGRLDKVERILDNRSLLDMLELLESLKVDMSTLRGEVEVQTHIIEQLKQKQRDLYTDVDRRLQRVETGKVATSSSTDLETIEAHSTYLSQNPGTTIVLEGHADERGSREYNLALAERRAQSVKQQMVLLGAASSQLRLVSYGEERPEVDGHDESSWQQNRRVEILY